MRIDVLDCLYIEIDKRVLRRYGKTTDRVKSLVDCIEVGCKNILVCISYHNDLNYLRPLINKILGERGIFCRWDNDDVLVVGEARCFFVPAAVSDRGTGYDARIMMRHED